MNDKTNAPAQKDGDIEIQNGQIMDVQPPSSPVQQPALSPQTVPPPAKQEQEEVVPAPKEAAADKAEQPAEQSKADKQSLAAAAPAAQRQSKKPIIAIVLAIITLFLLSGIAVLAYMQQNQGAAPAAVTEQSGDEQAETNAPATQEDVDEAIGEVDKTLQELEQSQIDETELSDESLEL